MPKSDVAIDNIKGVARVMRVENDLSLSHGSTNKKKKNYKAHQIGSS